MLSLFSPIIWIVFALSVVLATPMTVLRIRQNASEFRVMLPAILAVTATLLAAMGASVLSYSLPQEIKIEQIVETPAKNAAHEFQYDLTQSAAQS